MDIIYLLEEIGLSRYAETLSEFPLEDLVEFTDDDLKELGVLTPHRKKLLAAIASLNNDASSNDVSTTSDANKSSSSFSNFIRDLPQVIAIPLHEYAEEDHPGMKLWAACDAIELLLKFLVIIGAADRRQHGELDDKLLKELWGKIEMPTLGAWLSMAISLAQTKCKQPLMLPEIDQYVNETLKTLLYGPDNPGTADTSFLKLRNRLAHGGGLTRKEAERLISIWQDPFEKTIEALDCLRDIKIIGLDNNVPMELKGTSDNLVAADNLDISQFEGDTDGVWLVRDKNTLSLWPMALFGYPSVSNAKGNVETGDVNSTQIYVRKDVVQLQFTPLGAEGFSHSEAGVSAVEAFQSLFSLKRANQKATEKAFKIQDFGREIQKDANQMVGRLEEQEHIESSFRDIEQGIVWITGPAGIGKSFLVARLAQDLIDNNTDENKIILPYKFKSGDDARCNRDAFATFAIERLVAMGALINNVKVDEKGKAEDRLKSCLDYLNKDKKVIFVLDGLDELLSRDATFAEEIPLGLDSMRITWICSGRPEPELVKVFSNSRVINPYPNGLPAMQTQDIRSMLLERIGLFRNKLLAGDKEKGDEVVNPFIDLVAKRAEGLPLFVNYVTQDVQQGNYPLDSTANLPKGLTAYHEKLIEGLGVGALKELLTPLVATLAMANEPLAEQEIITFLRLRDRIPDGEAGDKLVVKGLAAIASMLRRAPDPEGEDGYMLHHLSLREHILTTETMSYPVEQARKAFAKAAMSPDDEETISNYLYRTGVDHLLSNNQVDDARTKLLNLDYLGKMFNLGKQDLDILQYWLKIGNDDQGKGYIASVNEYMERELNEENLDILEEFLQLCLVSGWYLTALNFAKKITDIFKFIKGEQHEDTLIVLSYFANLLDFDENHVEAEKIYRELLKIYKKNSGDQDTHEVLVILNQLGVCLLNQDKYVESEKIFREVLLRRERLNGKDHTTVFTCLNNLSLSLQGLNKYKDAELYLRRSLEGRLKVNGPDDTKTFTSMLNLASCLDDQNVNVEETEELYRKVLKGREIQLGINHPRYLIALKFFNLFLDKHEKYEEAELYIRQLFELREKNLGLNHKDTLNSLNSLAYTLSQINKYDEAEKFYLLALERHEEVYGLNHSNTHVVTSNLAYLYLNYEKHEKAEIYFKNSLEICKNIYGSEHEDTLEELENFIDFLEDKEDYKQADLLYNELLKSTQSLHGNEHEETLRTKQNYAVFLRNNTKEIEKALKLLEEVLLIRRKENNSGDVSSVLTALGTTYSQKGSFDKAHEAFLESINIRRKLYNDGDEDFKKPLISSLNRLVDLYKNNSQKEEMEKVELEIKNLSA